MYKLLNFFKSSALLKIVALISLLIYLSLIIIYKIKLGNHFINTDNYVGAFKTFQGLSYYDGVVYGTSVFYNLTLKLFNHFTGNIKHSFILVNGLSHLFLLVYGIYLLNKVNLIKKIYFQIIISLFVLFVLNQNYFFSASNDIFLAVFILMIFDHLIFRIYKNQKLFNFFSLGILTGICFAIRPTAIFMIPIIVYGLLVWFKDKNTKKVNVTVKLLLFFTSFMFLTIIFHYPSLKEKGTLSSYDKRPANISENWIQRNYLGWKKIEQGKESLNRDAIWIKTNFEVVREYLKENGEDSLPKSFIEVIKKDPVLLLKITLYNITYSTFRFIRFWGLLIFLLIIPLLRFNIKKIFLRQYLSSNIFIMIVIMISFTCLTFIEERWLIGYEVLIPMSILFYIKNITIDKAKLNTIFSVSLILISLMNIRSIMSYL